DIESKASYDSNLDKPALLVTPLFVSNEDECFDPGDDIELLLHCDPSTPKMSVLENIENKDSYDSNLDEPELLVTPLSDANEDECLDPRGDIDEIDAFDIP
nr:hypothetical protein [Tanacetum cinerariifolium]